MKRKDKEMYLILLREKIIRKARISFWMFCKALAPDFYTENKPHLKLLCTTLEKLYNKELLMPDGTPYTKLMLNLPP